MILTNVFDEVEVSVPANGSVVNVLDGRRYSRIPFPGFVNFYSTGSAAGLTEEINVGGASISPAVNVNTQNRSPVVPDDLRVAEVPVEEGYLIQVTATNTTGAALTYRLRMEVEPDLDDGMDEAYGLV